MDSIIVIDAAGIIEEFNRAAEQMFGYDAKEVLGRNISMLMPEPHRTQHDRYIERYLQTGEARIIGIGRETEAQRKDGHQFPIRLSVGEVKDADGPHFVGIVHDLTDYKRTQQALADALARAEAYLDLAEVVLLALDENKRVSMINRKGCELLGYDAEELLGRDWPEAFVPPQDADRVQRVLDSLIDSPDSVRYHENPVLTRDGRERLMAWYNRVTRDADGNIMGILSSGEDITERRAYEQALQKSEANLRAAQEIAALGNYELHVPPAPDDHVSPQLLRILGLGVDTSPEEAGQLFSELVHEDDRPAFDRAFRAALKDERRLDLEYRVVRPDGEIRWVHALAQPYTTRRSTRLLGILHDITERKLAEEDAARARERLMHVSRLSTVGEMASGLAHELNQPLTAITAYAQACQRMLSREPDPDDLRQALDQISTQALRAGEVISRIRSMVKPRESRREVSDCNRIVESLATLAAPDARAAGMELSFELAHNLPPVLADVVQIQQVLINLVRNAIDAMSHEKNCNEIVIRTRFDEASREVDVAVIDCGSGVPDDVAHQLFTPFFTTKPNGTGLGLSISSSIIRAHGGRLEYTPLESGSRFHFTLPAAPRGGTE